MIKPVRFHLLLLGVWASLAGASEWTYVRTPNFELFTSAGANDARKTVEYFEQVREFFMHAFAPEFTTPLPVTIVAFRSAAQFRPYAPNESAAGFYLGDKDRDYIVLSGAGPQEFPAAVHEYMHLLIRHSNFHPPLWLNEGIAQVYSTLKPLGSSVVIGDAPLGHERLLSQRNWIPLPQLFAVTESSAEYNERDRTGIFYAQSWLLTHMLMLDERYRPGFGTFLEAVSSGASTVDALRSAWNLSVEAAHEQMQSYARGRTLQGAKVPTRLGRFEGIEPRRAHAAEVEITLATLAGLLGRRDEAMERLQALAGKYPDRWRVHEAIALAAWRSSDIGLAREHFRRATELNSPDWQTWYDYARIMRGADDEEVAIRALRRVIELNPLHLEAKLLLAEEFNAVQRFRDALDTLATFHDRVPSELGPRYFLALGDAYAGLGDDGKARESALRAKEIARLPSELNRADGILSILNMRAAQRAPVQASAPPTVRRRITGLFEALDCMGTQARLVVSTADGRVSLLIRDPSMITIRGPEDTLELSCGPQKPPRQVAVDFLPRSSESHDTSGEVRVLEFQ